MQRIYKIITLISLILTTQLIYGKSKNLPIELKKAQLELPNKKKLNIELAVTEEEQTRGLSGVQSRNFSKDQGLFFFYLQDSNKGFWMPDTYFNLDIIFLDKDLKIVHIEKNVPAHPGLKEPPEIAKTPVISCRHVLEIRTDSDIGKGLKKGDKLKWLGTTSLSQIESKIRLLK